MSVFSLDSHSPPANVLNAELAECRRPRQARSIARTRTRSSASATTSPASTRASRARIRAQTLCRPRITPPTTSTDCHGTGDWRQSGESARDVANAWSLALSALRVCHHLAPARPPSTALATRRRRLEMKITTPEIRDGVETGQTRRNCVASRPLRVTRVATHIAPALLTSAVLATWRQRPQLTTAAVEIGGDAQTGQIRRTYVASGLLHFASATGHPDCALIPSAALASRRRRPQPTATALETGDKAERVRETARMHGLSHSPRCASATTSLSSTALAAQIRRPRHERHDAGDSRRHGDEMWSRTIHDIPVQVRAAAFLRTMTPIIASSQ